MVNENNVIEVEDQDEKKIFTLPLEAKINILANIIIDRILEDQTLGILT